MPATLVRPGEDDLFWLGTEEAIALGRSQAQLLRRSVRTFSGEPVAPELIEAAVAEALTAPAPHHTRPVRFVWMQDPARRLALLDRMKAKWRTDLTADGRPADSVERRVGRGQILYDAPELVIPFMVPDGAHSYPDAERTAAEHTMFTVAVGAAVQALLVALAVRGVGSCWIGSTIFAADLVRDELGLPADWEPLGAIAIGYPEEGRRRRAHAIRCRPTTCWCGGEPARLGGRGVDRLARTRSHPGHPAPRGAGVSGRPPGRMPARVRARSRHRFGARARPHRHPRAAHPAPAVRPVAATRRALRGDRRRHRRRRAAGGHRGVGHRRPDDRSVAGRAARPPGHLFARRADPPSRHAVHRARPGGCRDRPQRRVVGSAMVAAGRAAGRRATSASPNWRPRPATSDFGVRSHAQRDQPGNRTKSLRRRSSSGCRRRES